LSEIGKDRPGPAKSLLGIPARVFDESLPISTPARRGGGSALRASWAVCA
jgi:hypothetical protein